MFTLSPLTIGIVIVVVVALLLFKKPPQPQYVQRRQGLGFLEIVLLIVALGLTAYWFPWLITHLPLSNTPVHVMSAPVSPTPAKSSMAYYIDYARSAAVSAGINPDIFVRQMNEESAWNPKAISKAGAIGIAQFMPATAKALGVNPSDPEQSLVAAAKLMASYVKFFHGSYAMALAAYNAGTGRVLSAIIQAQKHGGSWDRYLPDETYRYIHIILGY